jgi:hypothetical protein
VKTLAAGLAVDAVRAVKDTEQDQADWVRVCVSCLSSCGFYSVVSGLVEKSVVGAVRAVKNHQAGPG